MNTPPPPPSSSTHTHTHTHTLPPSPLHWPCFLPRGTPLRQSTLTSIRAWCSRGGGRASVPLSRTYMHEFMRAHAHTRVHTRACKGKCAGTCTVQQKYLRHPAAVPALSYTQTQFCLYTAFKIGRVFQRAPATFELHQCSCPPLDQRAYLNKFERASEECQEADGGEEKVSASEGCDGASF